MKNTLRIGALLGAGMLVLGGCPRDTRTPTDERAERTEQEEMMDGEAVAERAEAIREADASQPGRVRAMMDGMLILEPYEELAGDARLEMSEDAPVFYRDSRVSTRALRPGVDVRVHYRLPDPGQQPHVVAVEILEPQEAEQLQRRHERDHRQNQIRDPQQREGGQMPSEEHGEEW